MEIYVRHHGLTRAMELQNEYDRTTTRIVTTKEDLGEVFGVDVAGGGKCLKETSTIIFF